jgi:hypothetical protein
MNTLADEFLADLGEDEPSKEENKQEDEEDEEKEEEMDIDIGTAKISDPKTLTKLLGSDRLTQALNVSQKTTIVTYPFIENCKHTKSENNCWSY